MNTIRLKQFVRHAMQVNSRGIASAALAVRMAAVPILPLASAVDLNAADQNDEPPLVYVTLSIKNAPIELNASVPEVYIKVGESEKEARIRAEQEAKRIAEEAQKEAVNRYVVSRYSPARENGGLNIEQARDLTVKYAEQYGVDPVLMSKIVSCESGYNQYAKNSRSTASGYGQFIAGTWRSTISALGWDPATSPFDGEKNLEATAYLISVRGTSPWNASRGCWANR